MAALRGDGWAIRDLRISLDLAAVPLTGSFSVGRITVDGGMEFDDVRGRCNRVELAGDTLACEDAELRVDVPGSGPQRIAASLRYQRAAGRLVARLSALPLAGGQVDLRATTDTDATELVVRGRSLDLAELALLFSHYGYATEGVSTSGLTDLDVTLRWSDERLSAVSGTLRLDAAAASNEAGTAVTEGLDAAAELELARVANGWSYRVGIEAVAGEVYVEPAYANLGEQTLSFTAGGDAADDFSRVAIDRFDIRQGNVIDAGGSLDIGLPPGAPVDVSGELELHQASVPALYTNLVRVLAAGTMLGDLETAGSLSGRLALAGSSLVSLDLSLDDIHADDRRQRFAVYGLDGRLRWPGPGGNAADAGVSELTWAGASVHRIPLGPGRVVAALGGRDLLLLEPLRVPAMGGALLVKQLSVEAYGTPEATGLLDAELEPIQLAALTTAFGWPPFGGTLSGRLPLLRYDEEVMTVGGTLVADAFDGRIEFANLRLEQPFGRVPRLTGDLALRRLDLELLTNTFSFGLIQGRLSGDVTGLTMISWRPTAMDMHLYTPPDDDSRHRISQRAVENLASVGGGGASAALSTGFMSLFDEFSYRRIGLRCVLRDGTCLMSGAGPARKSELGQGYYIVEGSGLPRIDVVGFRREVSWTRLVRQLTQVTQSSGPAVR